MTWSCPCSGTHSVAPAYRIAVLLGLVLTFVLGASGGMLLGTQPSAGMGLAVVSWSRIGGDLLAAHFMGIHAGRVLPVIGFALATGLRRGALAGVWLAAAVWTRLWAMTLTQVLHGLPMIGEHELPFEEKTLRLTRCA